MSQGLQEGFFFFKRMKIHQVNLLRVWKEAALERQIWDSSQGGQSHSVRQTREAKTILCIDSLQLGVNGGHEGLELLARGEDAMLLVQPHQNVAQTLCVVHPLQQTALLIQGNHRLQRTNKNLWQREQDKGATWSKSNFLYLSIAFFPHRRSFDWVCLITSSIQAKWVPQGISHAQG